MCRIRNGERKDQGQKEYLKDFQGPLSHHVCNPDSFWLRKKLKQSLLLLWLDLLQLSEFRPLYPVNALAFQAKPPGGTDLLGVLRDPCLQGGCLGSLLWYCLSYPGRANEKMPHKTSECAASLRPGHPGGASSHPCTPSCGFCSALCRNPAIPPLSFTTVVPCRHVGLGHLPRST